MKASRPLRKFPTRSLDLGYAGIVAHPTSKHQMAHAEAIKAGMKVHGLESIIVPGNAHVKSLNAVCWGWRNGEPLRQRGCEVMVMERGYIGDRMNVWSSLMMNGLNGRGGFPRTPDDHGERFNKYHADLYKPWSPNPEGYALLIGQVAGDAALQGKDLTSWYQSTAKKLLSLGYEVVFRHHPGEVARGFKRKVDGVKYSTNTDIKDDIAGAQVVVTFNSNSGVDACLAGKPVIATDKGSMAYAVSSGSIGSFSDVEPSNRRKWAESMAWCQWTLDEIASGEALRGFLLDRPEPGKIQE